MDLHRRVVNRGHRAKGNEPFRPRFVGKEEVEHAQAMAEADELAPGMRAGKPLLPRLIENGMALAATQRELTKALRARLTVPPAGEWLLDNYYVVEQQLQQVRHDLSPTYYYELPKLASGPFAGYPRVYGIAVDLIGRNDNRLTQDGLVRFVGAYQQVAPLSIGEVWAIPIMLRIVLIDNLRWLMDQVRQDVEWQRAANATAEDLLTAGIDPAYEFPEALARLKANPASRNSTFVIQLMMRLRDQDPAVAPALTQLETEISSQNTTLEDLIRGENQRRSYLRALAGNAVSGLRLISALDWHIFFTEVNVVEQVLNDDPAGAYSKMDFDSRDRYRHVVETLAHRDPRLQVEIARRAVELARRAEEGTEAAPAQGVFETNNLERRKHVGYYLMDDGRAQLEREVGYEPPMRERISRTMMQHALAFYLGLIGVILASLVLGAVAYGESVGASAGQMVLIAVVTLVPLSVIAVGAVNWTLTVELEPNPPPKLDLQGGIPPEYTTMIVIPALIVNQSGLEFLLEHLELRFLANRDENLHFAILGDFADSPQEHMPEDDALVQTARARVTDLNEKYERADAFFFFHRRRLWNESEKRWMGWERKRGKLEEFNVLLRGGETSYIVREGNMSLLPRVKYVITLDADTELPMQVARRLVGTIAHPLNRAVLDPVSRIVTHGYGIIQPRVDVVAPAAKRSHFAKLFAGDTGLDPYASVVSNVYQDFFARAVYIGKAIYDVDALLGALHGRFPENLLLSHDLLEGGYVRVGFASDVELLEDFPSGFDTFAQRQHRWVRGDWQVTDWLLPRVRDGSGRLQKNPLPLVERWKLFDNVRRSLVPFSVLLLLVTGWVLLPGSHVVWTGLAVFCLIFAFVRSALGALGDRPAGESAKNYLWVLAQELWTNAQRAMVTVIFLAYFTTVNLDAIGHVLVRRTITRRDLLEWTSHAVAERGHVRALGDYIARMWLASVFAALLAPVIWFVAPHTLAIAVPLLLLWFLAPSIAYSISQPYEPRRTPLPGAAQQQLRVTARRIWRFYEDFAGAGDHWLPPDNYQVEPNAMVAHRTSPTNIGFLLLSMIAALDFGYLEAAEFAERAEQIFQTLDRLERQRGHFFNWYDTTTLTPLYPQYISTVDSGNMLASLIAFKQACYELVRTPRNPARARSGLADTLAALADALQSEPGEDFAGLRREVERLRTALGASDGGGLAPAQVQSRVLYLARLAKRLGMASPLTREIRAWCDALNRQAEQAMQADERSLPARLEALARRAGMIAEEMDFTFLYDEVRGVFAIGYNASNHRRDDSYYDLLASEARLTSLVTVARGEIPVKHWFRTGRPLTRLMGKAVLLSWGGTMFEYLMPTLLLRDFAPSLLEQTNLGVIQEQIAYAAQQNMPWGISESGFYAFDYQFNFQYRAFGVPELSLKRDTLMPRVVAPYATFLALPFAPHAASQNLNVLADLGADGEYGFYEALDFTPEHLPQGQRVAVVSSYMAHHQGMSLVALDNFINGYAMQKRFQAEPMIAAAELLLQERVPRHASMLTATKQERPVLRAEMMLGPTGRQFTTPHTFTPRTHLLSNNSYSVMLTNAGSGYSSWSHGNPPVDNAVTRWRADPTLDALGTFCYIRDTESSRVWSNTYQPTCAAGQDYHVAFQGETVEFARRDADIETKTVVYVAPENDAEIRQLTFTNLTDRSRTLELTTYAEVVLDAFNGDAAHPAFSKLFVESEFVPGNGALLFRRRPRSPEHPERWAVHYVVSDSPLPVREYEADRLKFIGRGRTLADPAALYMPLSNTVGATLDPIMSLRTRVHLGAHGVVNLAFVTGAANTRDAALALCDDLLDKGDLEHALELARSRGQMELRHLGITPVDATLYQRFASRVIFPDPHLRAATDVQARNTRGQTALWAYGISGDYPIVLVRVAGGDGLALVSDALRAHEYWRLRNFHVDLVILDEQATTYTLDNLGAIQGLVGTSLSRPWLDKPGGVFIRRRDHIPPEDYMLFETMARVILRGEVGSLADQLNLSTRHVGAVGARARRSLPAPPAALPENDGRALYNGLGGFSEDGREYIITLNEGQWTPTPWTNVIASPDFGCLVTDSGLGMTWANNSQQNKLTPWSNDPVCDPPAEVMYLQDIGTDALWTPTPIPIREAEEYRIRHGTGYSVFEHTSHELAQSVRVSVAPDDPVKIIQLTVRNLGAETRHVRVTYFAEWVLGMVREQAQYFVVTEYDSATRAIFAWNVYGQTSPSPHASTPRIAFAAATEIVSGWTASRTEFMGRNGTYALPAALTVNARPLSGQVGASYDPCAALQVEIEVPPGEETQVEFLLGQGENRTHARALIQKYTDRENLVQAMQEVGQWWNELLETVQVKTPDAAMDVLLNRWLLYQTLACRVWGRSAFYQSGGAYGFRDQLQDVMALVHAAPGVARRQILRAAAHQFAEGDVMHWWHPALAPREASLFTESEENASLIGSAAGDRGVRTHISDDYLWLPYVTDIYVRATGDTEILNVQVPYVILPLPGPDEEEVYGSVGVTQEMASVYDHCVRALDHGLRFGEHGLPLMGTGDWNDGMNRVGAGGKGESVWLGWFLHANLMAFDALAAARGDNATSLRYRAEAERLRAALNENAWDGEWYRRAYFDDGSPLGSKENAECSIDAIAQAWAVISGAAPLERQTQALRAVQERLVLEHEKMILLLNPPFVESQPSPGYIQGYVAGIRENGGQYTHGALWVVLAHCLMGEGDRAHQLYQMLNPLNHTRTAEQVNQYKLEPYVVAADVYSHPQHRGRGGWTWYTGSASWMYRIGIEYLLGLKHCGNCLTVEPCIPKEWSEYEIVYRCGATRFEIVVENPEHVSRGVRRVELDDQIQETVKVRLIDDGQTHRLRVVMGEG